MKKKHRDIVVDGVQYGWTIDSMGYCIVIWKDKKQILEKINRPYQDITPKLIEELIRIDILNQVLTKTVHVCTNCNSDNVQIKAWVKPNENNKFIDEVDDKLGWCSDCYQHTIIETAELNRQAKIIGYQVIGVEGNLKEGEMHPDMDGSFCVYSLDQANKMMKGNKLWRLETIWDGDIEEPTMMFEGNLRD